MYYKYVNFETAKLILSNSNLKLTNPVDFNDPFDCCFPSYTDNKFVQKKLKEILKKIPGFKNYYKSAKQNNYDIQSDVSKLEKELKNDFNNLLDDIRLENWKPIISKHRILCLSNQKDNILMWSHYADKHQGIVLGFDFNDDLDEYKNIKKVAYNSKKIEEFTHKILNLLFDYLLVHPQDILSDDISNKIDKIFSSKKVEEYFINIFNQYIVEYFWIKYEIWAYENEYRLVVKENSFDKDLIPFKQISLKEVIIGLKFNENNKEELDTILQKFKNIEIKFAKESKGRLIISKK